MYAVVFNYSFDEDVAVYLFNTIEEAQKNLRKFVLEEFRIDTEENGWVASYEISESGMYGSITTHFFDRDDMTEVRVGTLYSMDFHYE